MRFISRLWPSSRATLPNAAAPAADAAAPAADAPALIARKPARSRHENFSETAARSLLVSCSLITSNPTMDTGMVSRQSTSFAIRSRLARLPDNRDWASSDDWARLTASRNC